MNNNYDSYSVNGNDSSNEKNRKFKLRFIDVLIFIVCLISAFIFWCYALYIDDPVIEKSVIVNFVLENGNEGDKLSQSSAKIVLYGEQSILAHTRNVTVTIDRSQFDLYNHDTLVTFELPDDFYCEKNEIVIQLTNTSNK